VSEGATMNNLVALVEAMISQGEPPKPEQLQKLSEAVSQRAQVRVDEVAILVLMQDENFLRFVYPEELKGIGLIPLTGGSSLAARTAREKRPVLNNQFVIAPHASVFEAVRLNDRRTEPIQKIMSVPIVVGPKVAGVLQVSRKGATPAAAGPDFTIQDLRKLSEIALQIAPCIPLLKVK
jgi:GAF domain-containing protein